MRARRSRSAVVTAATLGVLLATGAVVSSPAAYAADAPAAATASAEPTAQAGQPSLTVNTPESFGNGGEPVEFSETVTNPGTADASYKLWFDASNPEATSGNQLTVDYRDADGAWKPVDLAFTNSGGHFTGGIPTALTVAGGATKTVQLRLGLPISNNWGSHDLPIKLDSTVLDASGHTALAESTKTVTAKALTVQVGNAPTTAVAGGAPVEFDVTVTNPSAARYTDVAKVIEADQRSKLQVQNADGSWETVTAAPDQSGRVRYHLTADKTLAPGASFTRHVRLSFAADAPTGTTYIHPWAMLGEGGALAPVVCGPQFVAINVTSGPTLSVQPPSSIGNSGKPVEFTETVTNPGSTDATYTLKLNVSNPAARSTGRFAVDYRDADGTWKPVTLNFSQGEKTFNFSGEIPGVSVAAGTAKTLQLRLSAPVNNDWPNAHGTVTLHSAIVDGANTVVSESTKDVEMKSLGLTVKNAPSTAAIGGAPVEFDFTVDNQSASDYDNLSPVVVADRNSKLQVQQADGSWADITGTPNGQAGGPLVYHLTTDKNLAAKSSFTKHVRLAFTADAPIGRVYVTPAVILAEQPAGSQYADAWASAQGFSLDLTATPAEYTGKGTDQGTGTAVKAGLTSTTDTGSTADSTGGTGGTATTDTQLTGGSLAHTGSDGMLSAAAAAAGLLASGIGAIFFSRRRRNA
ncbi:LPXTG cell wall anchor domain-containing protein [Kitasatospora sp. NPDC028055]|uniref:LPXTG cell wall anchor domain-containing protein n=1 Tax=Kitasatospora sp. NPDC028055 TaxID=3155653 RepID=UPI0033C10964